MRVDPTNKDPTALLGQMQLAFILFLNLSSYPCLSVYKRILPLFTRSSSYLTGPYETSRAALYNGLLETLSAQLAALPDGVFDTELPELDGWYLEEIDTLRTNLLLATSVQGGWKKEEMTLVKTAWDNLVSIAKTKWRWDLGSLSPSVTAAEVDEEDDEDEEGEYAPVVVEM
jgi:A1 cistron-splicing factor AAR2